MICLLRHVSYAFARSLGGNHIDSSLHLCVRRMYRVSRADIVPHVRNAVFLFTITNTVLLGGLWYHDSGMHLLFRMPHSLWTALLRCAC